MRATVDRFVAEESEYGRIYWSISFHVGTVCTSVHVIDKFLLQTKNDSEWWVRFLKRFVRFKNWKMYSCATAK